MRLSLSECSPHPVPTCQELIALCCRKISSLAMCIVRICTSNLPPSDSDRGESKYKFENRERQSIDLECRGDSARRARECPPAASICSKTQAQDLEHKSPCLSPLPAPVEQNFENFMHKARSTGRRRSRRPKLFETEAREARGDFFVYAV